MLRPQSPAGIAARLFRRRRDRSIRLFAPAVLNMEARVLLTATDTTTGLSYGTIQAAINAANPHDEIDVSPGTYQEQLTINKWLTIVGTGGAANTTILAPPSLNADASGLRSIVTIGGDSSTMVSLSGFTIEGTTAPVETATSPLNPGGVIDAGVFVRDGAAATIDGNTITNITGNNDGRGYGVLVGYSAANTTGTATITNDVISNYQKNGIYVEGAGSSAAVGGSTITGLSGDTLFAQNGIVVIDGAFATIGVVNGAADSNTISGNYFNPPGDKAYAAAGVVLYNAAPGSLVQGNTLNGNDVAIENYAPDATAGTTTTIQNNTIDGQGIVNSYGIVAISAATTVINSNIINGTAIGIDADSTGPTTIEYNLIQATASNSQVGIELDSGTSTLLSNAIYGGPIGIGAYSYTGNTADTVVTATLNTIYSTVALDAEDTDTTDTPTVRLTANNNDLSGSGNSSTPNASIVTTNGPVVDASDNYWGTVDPAAVMAKANGGVNVDYTPYQGAAFSNQTLYVVADGEQVPAGAGRIQEAVDLAPAGGTVNVEPGTYTEQVTINKSLTVVGIGGAANTTIQAPAGLTAYAGPSPLLSIVTITGASTVANFAGFTVTGPPPTNPDYPSNGGVEIDAGVYVRDGATATIRRDTITNITGNNDGLGYGVAVGRTGDSAADSTTGTATIEDDQISGFQKNGIFVDGAGSSATILRNTITGLSGDTLYAQNGIVIIRGAFGTIGTAGTTADANTISGFEFGGTSGGPDYVNDTQAIGVLLFGAADGTTVSGNTIDGNDIGIYSLMDAAASTATISGNVLGGKAANRYEGIFLDEGTSVVSGNTITGGLIGVAAASFAGNTYDTVGTLTGNTISSTQAIQVYVQPATTAPASNVVLAAHNNDLSGSTGTTANPAIVTTNGPVVDASDNYWGTVVPAAVKAKANGGTNVDYTPYQGAAFSNQRLYVVADGQQVPATAGRIQEAVDLATAGGTVNVEPGTYQEQVTIAKSLNVTGVAGGGNLPTIQAPAGLGSTANIVTISGTNDTFQNFNLAGPAAPAGAINAGVALAGATSATVQGVTTTGQLRYGIIADAASSTPTITANTIRSGVLPAGGQAPTGVGILTAASGTYALSGNTVAGTADNGYVYTGIEVDGGIVTVGDGTSANANTVSGYYRNGILVNGLGAIATVAGNTITGIGSAAAVGEFGVAVVNGGLASVLGNTITNNQTASTQGTNSVGVLLNGARDGTAASGNILDSNDIGIAVADADGTSIASNLINTGAGSAGGEGIDISSAGTTTLAGNVIDATNVGIRINATGATLLNGGTITGTPSGFAGIEVDAGTLTASGLTIAGYSGGYGLYAVGLGGPVTVNLTTTQINGANVGIFVDSTRPSTAASYATTVNVNDNATKVNSPVSHGAVLAGPRSSLYLTSAPTLTQAASSPTYTTNQDGSYNATLTFSGMDNITSANDLVYRYSLDGGAFMTTTSPLTLSNLSQGTHTVALQVMNQGTAGNTTTTQVITLSDGVSDGGFESPAMADGQFMYQPAGAPWTFGGNSGISANNSAFTNGNPNAPEGKQVAILQRGDGTTGANGSYFSQQVTFQNTGNYVITFQAAQRGNFQQSVQNFLVQVDGATVGTFTPASTSYQALSTAQFAITTTGAHTITFIGIDSAGGDNTALIDKIVAAPVQVVTTPSLTVGDGGFESPPMSVGQFMYRPNNTPWTFGGDSGISANNSGFTNGNPPAPEGAQVAILQGGNGTTGANGSYFLQQVDFGSGGTFVINFQAAQRGNYQASVQNFLVQVDGVTYGTFTPASKSYQALSTGQFTVSAGVHTIAFIGLDSAGGDNTAFIDNITIAKPTNVPTLGDSGFESPTFGVGQGAYAYRPTTQNDPTSANYNPWTFFDSAGISGNGSAFTSGNPNAPEGTQVAFLQQKGSFSQNFTAGTSGTYAVTFQAAQRGNFGSPNEDFMVQLIDTTGTTPTTVYTSPDIQPAGTTYQSLSTGSFSLVAGHTYTIYFVGLNKSGSDATALIDNIAFASA